MHTPTSIARLSALARSVAKARDYALLTKFRLSFLVVLSALLGYFFADAPFSAVQLLALIAGGFLVTGASNAFNQIIERELDARMSRTAQRPLPAGNMSVQEATIAAALMGFVGILILWFLLNALSGVLGLLALLMYVALYTPLKRKGPIAVFVGAFPGAIPPMLGYVAHTGQFGLIPGLLFATQFIWQFPHFWAIAWKSHDDYLKAGYYLLPAPNKGRSNALIIFLYTLFLIPISLVPVYFVNHPWPVGGIVLLAGVLFAMYAWMLYKNPTDKPALNLMFYSFVYLPIVQIAYLF
jgi:protoheme IX farnesyltransferase